MTTASTRKLFIVNFQKASGRPGRILFRMPNLHCDPSEMCFQFGPKQASARQVIYTFADEEEALFSHLEQAALACVSELRQIMAALGASDIPLVITYSGREPCKQRRLCLRLAPSKVPALRDSLLKGADVPDFTYSGFRNSVALVVLIMRLTQLKGLIAEELGLDSRSSTQDILQAIETHVSVDTSPNASARTYKGGAFLGQTDVRTNAIRKIRTHYLLRRILQEVPLGAHINDCSFSFYNEEPRACEQELGIPQTLTTLVTCLQKLLRQHCEIQEAEQLLERFLVAIEPGTNLSGVFPNFVAELILDNKDGLMAILGHLPDRNRWPRQAALQGVAEMFTKQCVQPDRWKQRAAQLKRFDENDYAGAINCARELACLLAALSTINMGAIPATTVEQFIVSITQRIGYHYRQRSGDFNDMVGADVYYAGIYIDMCERLLKLAANAPTVPSRLSPAVV